MSERPFKLHSVADVLALWPEGSRPSTTWLKRTARKKGYCRVLGRSMAFTDSDIEELTRIGPNKRFEAARKVAPMPRTYFVQCGDLVKIGKARDPRRRLIMMQTGNPVQLTLLLVCHGYAAPEKELHKQFAHLRVRGEWFRYGEEISGYIAEYIRKYGRAYY